MNRFTRLALVAAAGLAFAASGAHGQQAPRTAQAAAPAPIPKGVWPQAVSDVAPDPAVRFGTLPNGMRYAIMKNATPSGQAAFRMRFDAGSLMERDDQQGLAHFLEHMAFNGSKAVPEGEMIKILERLGLAFGADTNASTGFTETIYQLDLPRTDDETVDTSLKLMREAASELLIAQEAVDRERGVVLSEERARDTPGLRAFMTQLALEMPGHIATQRLPIGKVEVLRSAPRQAIVDYYNAYYRPERAVFVAVGDFDVDAMEAKIKARFSDWNATGPAGPEYPRLLPQPREIQAKVFVDPGVQPQIQLSWISPPDLDPDTVAERRSDLVEGLAFAVFNRRLERISRSGEPPFIAAAGFRGDQFHSANVTTLVASAQQGRWREALAAIEQEQRRFAQFGVRPEELQREIDSMRANLKTRADAAATRRTPALANQLISSIEYATVHTSPAQDLAFFEEAVRTITAEDASAAAKAAFAGSGPLVFMASPTPIEGEEQAVLAALNQSRAVAVTLGEAQLAKTWPYESFGPRGKVAEEQEVADLDTVFVRFENGVRLTVKPTKFRDEQILVTARIADGRLRLPTDRANALWASSAFTEGGLDQLTAEEVEDVLRSKIVGAGFATEDDAFSLSGSTRPEDLKTQLQLMTAYAVRPGWRPEAFLRMKTFGATLHDQQDATPSGVFGRELGKLIHGGDARWAFPSREEIADGKPEDLRAILENPLSAGPIEVIIVGDITVEKAVEAVADTFGALPPRPGPQYTPGTARTVSAPAPAPTPVVLTHKGRADQGIAFIAWPTDDYWADVHKARTLRVLADILTLRLIDEIREKQGTTYSPSASASASNVFENYGFVSASIEAQPDRLEPFFADVMKIAADLRNEPVTADELDRAKRPAVEALEKRFETNEFWLGQLSGAQADRRRLDAIRSARAGIQRITAADIQAVAREYLRDDRTWKVVVRPEATVAANAR